jgi:DNA-binding CsgD family transcriptional regulator
MTEVDLRTSAAILAALRAAQDAGSATQALAAEGWHLPASDWLDMSGDGYDRLLGQAQPDGPLREAIGLGFMAGMAAPHKRQRPLNDVTAFLMDRDLVVQAAEGESILRLPWFEEELFVGRQLPDVVEIPDKIRSLAVTSYQTALGGEKARYTFTSYGHTYAVDAIPIRGEDGQVVFALAAATPSRSATTALASDPMVTRPECTGEGRGARGPTTGGELTPRELEVLALASHGLSYCEIAQRLVVAPATVKTHLAHCYAKLNAHDKAQAVATALRKGLIA